MTATTPITLDLLLAASTAGGASCLTSVTELRPAAGWQASIAPAKFSAGKGGPKEGIYAFEQRYLDGVLRTGVLVDSKQSQLNRIEATLSQAMTDGHPLISRLPHVAVTYQTNGQAVRYTDLDLPHRIFDGHIRAASSADGTPVTTLPAYRAARDATPANFRALLDISPITVVCGGWDSSRKSRQVRTRSILTGEIFATCDSELDAAHTPHKGGGRVDPVGMQFLLDTETLQAISDVQQADLGAANGKVVDKKDKASTLGLGGIPPTLSALAGIACDRIIRSHVLSFAALRQLRFGAGPDGDAACRALLAALALNGLARSDAELNLRANCDLQEAGRPVMTLDQRHGDTLAVTPLTIPEADDLLSAALAHAERVAGIQWSGSVLEAVGNQAIVDHAQDAEDAE